jgi:membrane-associated phospholipid phosphatase
MKAAVALWLVLGLSVATASAQTANPPTAAQAPEAAQTGWSTLAKDIAADFATFPQRRSTWVILGLGAATSLAVRPGDPYVKRQIVGNGAADTVFSLGQWLGATYVQVGSAVGLWAVGRYVVAPVANEPRSNRFSEIGFDLIRAQAVSQTIVHTLKQTTRRQRPTGECCAFPSGHATAAFAAASVLERHLGYRGAWPALLGATYVATSRLVDNRHFLSDVVMGSAIGMATGWTVVGRNRPNQIALQPVPVPGGLMLAFTHTTGD